MCEWCILRAHLNLWPLMVYSIRKKQISTSSGKPTWFPSVAGVFVCLTVFGTMLYLACTLKIYWYWVISTNRGAFEGLSLCPTYIFLHSSVYLYMSGAFCTHAWPKYFSVRQTNSKSSMYVHLKYIDIEGFLLIEEHLRDCLYAPLTFFDIVQCIYTCLEHFALAPDRNIFRSDRRIRSPPCMYT